MWLAVCLFSGHGRSGALSHHHHSLLPRCHGLHSHVWHHQRGILQRRPGLVGDWLEACDLAQKVKLSSVMLLCVCRATQIKTYSWDNAQVIMVGNKCDMDEERVVPPEKGKHLADQLGETQLSFTSGGTDSRRNVSSSLAWDGWSERKTASGPRAWCSKTVEKPIVWLKYIHTIPPLPHII